MTRISIASPNSPASALPFSPGVRVGQILAIAGQAGLDPATGEVVPGGLEAEVVQTFHNIKAVLEAQGASLDDVVRVDVYLTDPADFGPMNAIYATMFSSPPPARTTVFVGLVPPLKVEITVLAVLPQDA